MKLIHTTPLKFCLWLAIGPGCGTSTSTGNPDDAVSSTALSESAAVDAMEALTGLLSSEGSAATDSTLSLGMTGCSPTFACAVTGETVQVDKTFVCSDASSDSTIISITGGETLIWTPAVGQRPACNTARTHIAINLNNAKNIGASQTALVDRKKSIKRTYRRRSVTKERLLEWTQKGTRTKTFTNLSPTRRDKEMSTEMVHQGKVDGAMEYSKTISMTKVQVSSQFDSGVAMTHEIGTGVISVKLATRGTLTQTVKDLKFSRVGSNMCCIPVAGTIRATFANADGTTGTGYTMTFSQPSPEMCPTSVSILLDNEQTPTNFEELQSTCDFSF